MIIQHNIAALNTYRQLNKASQMQGKALEKLSSGLRINRAGDDAAGLAISEKMRGQIRGLTQASRNTQDAISLIQTAEGGLQEIHAILQRGRELMVQAANDTNSLLDREAIQSEVEQLIEEVNHIANATQFNGISLLGGNGVVMPPSPPPVGNFGTWAGEPVATVDAKQLDPNMTLREKIATVLRWSMLEQGEKRIISEYGLPTGSTQDMRVDFINDRTSSTMAYVSYYVNSETQKGFGISLVVNEAYFQEIGWPDGGTYPMYLDRVIAHELVHASMAATMSFGDMPKWFKEGAAEFIAGADERLLGDLTYSGGVAGVIGAIGDGTDTTWKQKSVNYSAGYTAVRYMHEKLKPFGGMKALMTELSRDVANPVKLDQAINTVSGGTYQDLATFVDDFKSNGADYLQGLIDSGKLNNDDVGAIGGADADGGTELNARDVIPDNYNPLDQPLQMFDLIWPSGMENVSGEFTSPNTGFTAANVQLPLFDQLTFQVGANAGQTVELDLFSATASDLNIQNADAVSRASDGISIFSDAIESVSSHRAYFGAMQNRLEHTLTINDQYNEQLTAAESRIRDVDIAREVMEMTKQNILLQVSQAMLANANRQPEGVLQLLR